MLIETTFRVIDLLDRTNVGPTAANPGLAKLAAGDLNRSEGSRFAIEQTEWAEDFGKPKVRRSVIIDAEEPADRWKLGL